MLETTTKRCGRFIVFEGLDGAGTTTQMDLLAQYLRKKNLSVVTTSEPTQGPMGLILRLLLSNRLIIKSGVDNIPELEFLSSSSIALLFAADRLDHLQHMIIPKLQEQVFVLCDRYYLSSYAYQMAQNRDNLSWLKIINSRCIVPDLTIFIDTPLDVCAQRRSKQRWYEELYEKTEILEQVSKNYRYVMDLAEKEMPVQTIDGNHAKEIVLGEVILALKRNFPTFFSGDLPLFPAH